MDFDKLEFRGIDLVTGEWIYGGCLDWQRDTPIIINHGNRHHIKPGTESVFTGFLDNTGKKIFTKQVVYIAGFGELYVRDSADLMHLYDVASEDDIGAILVDFADQDPTDD